MSETEKKPENPKLKPSADPQPKKSADSKPKPSADPKPKTSADPRFLDLPLSSEVQKAIGAVGYETPTPIQARAIPFLLEGRDILGVAQTGTGKTGAFALPLLSNLDTQSKLPQVLCLCPTRELAIQVAEAFQTYAKFIKGFRVLPVYGGADYRGQIRELKRGVQVVVGTPGRVMDHIRKGTLVLDGVKAMVLDEADEMLSMGFIDDIEWILEQTPKEHQTALFSATMPWRIKKIIDKYLKDPAEVTIKDKTATMPKIRQRYLRLRHGNEKLDALTRILEVEEFDAVLVFVRTKNATLQVAERLQARGLAAEALNGDIAQNQREKTVGRLKNGNIDIIVGTDVAARGLDVPRISHVVNYDVPYDSESYVHRIGRTGRAGREGDAILFVTGRERHMLQAIERTMRQQIDRYVFPTVDVLNERKIEGLFSRIDGALQNDLKEYSSVITKYLKRNEVDPTLLAAAMASLEGGSETFYLKETHHGERYGRDQDRGRNQPRREGRDRSRNRDRDQGRRPDRRPTSQDASTGTGSRTYRREEIATETYRLEVGKAHGVSIGDVVGAIANETGIDGQYIGKIRLLDEHTYIDLPEGLPRQLYKKLKKVWVRGRQLRISKDSAKPESDRKSERSWNADKKARPSGSSKTGRSAKPKKRKIRRPNDSRPMHKAKS